MEPCGGGKTLLTSVMCGIRGRGGAPTPLEWSWPAPCGGGNEALSLRRCLYQTVKGYGVASTTRVMPLRWFAFKSSPK